MTKAASAPIPSMEDFTWTVDQYHQLIGAGIITPNHRVELLDGAIIKKMGINEPHSACVDGLHEFFYDKYGKKYTLRSENPVILDDRSEPEPDFAICVRRDDRYINGHPTVSQLHLIIEVADSTVDKDRHYKGPLYARAGIVEYWIINLDNRQVEVHLQPLGSVRMYRSITTYLPGETFDSPFNGPTSVNELLPFSQS